MTSTFPKSPADREQARRGPLVYLDYDQAALDSAYDQHVHAANGPQVISRYASNSESTRRRIGPATRISYGPTPIECLEIYRTGRPGAPVFIFVHGGAWRTGRAANYAFPAELFLNAGAHYVVLDFIGTGDEGGSLEAMVTQVRRAVAWVHANGQSFGADPDRIFVGGHSSGGHLAALCLVTDWPEQFGLPSNLIKGGLCSSGVYDMRAVRLSARNGYLMLDEAAELSMSPQRHLDNLQSPLIVSYGTCETPEFRRQALEFADAAAATGNPVSLLVGENYNHFEMLETLSSPYGLLGRAALTQMGLA